MGDNLFEGLPPPSQQLHKDNYPPPPQAKSNTELVLVPPPPKSALKSALKRPKLVESTQEPEGSGVEMDLAAPEKKKLRFKTTTDASAEQVIEAMQKIASHIKNPTKFSKASKLAIQLIHAGSVTPSTSDQFFAILEVSMSSTISCTDPSVRADYHALFSAAQDAAECLNRKQKNQLETWSIMTVVANDLFTDDSFVTREFLATFSQFSKTAGQVKETISKLPTVTEDDDAEEAAILLDQNGTATDVNEETGRDTSGAVAVEETKDNEADPFGLDALIPSIVKKDERAKTKDMKKEEDFEFKRYLRSQREAVTTCLEIAARRYKTPWCQTVIDILVQHAHDNIQRFTSKQRDAIEKLWASVREQHVRRKQGKSVNGKLDVTAFEWLQEKYSTETISIRRAVGSSGERRAQQWLG